MVHISAAKFSGRSTFFRSSPESKALSKPSRFRSRIKVSYFIHNFNLGSHHIRVCIVRGDTNHGHVFLLNGGTCWKLSYFSSYTDSFSASPLLKTVLSVMCIWFKTFMTSSFLLIKVKRDLFILYEKHSCKYILNACFFPNLLSNLLMEIFFYAASIWSIVCSFPDLSSDTCMAVIDTGHLQWTDFIANVPAGHLRL